jgi:N utilization substance protein A
MKAEGIMPRKEMIPGERFRIHDRLRALVAEVKESPRGPQIILSRTHRNFLRRLLENEVPEIYHGIVEIRSIAREPGQRAKVAVSAAQPGIDPVGACVGIKGTRIQAIVRELHNEKIDVIEWNSDLAIFIMKAISPARVSGVYLNEHGEEGKTATVVVSEDQLSLAIGRDGQNARLAAKLTNWRIDIKSLPEAAADALFKLKNDETLVEIAEAEKEVVPVIEDMLARKAEGKPLPPEEYDQMVRFVDRIEKRTIEIKAPLVKEIPDDTLLVEIKTELPAGIFDQNILDSGLPEHVAYTLQEAGIETTGALVEQIRRDSDHILGLQGIGPKAMGEINKLVNMLLPVKEELVVEPVVEAPILESIPLVEGEKSKVVEPAAEQAEPESGKEPVTEEPELSFDELFKMETLKKETVDEEEEIEAEIQDKKKKKAKSVIVEYDPDRDITIARKKHKRGDDLFTNDE